MFNALSLEQLCKAEIRRLQIANEVLKPENNLLDIQLDAALAHLDQLGTHKGKSVKRVVQGVSGTVHKRKQYRITDHRCLNFVYPNQENKQVRYSF